MNPDTKIVGLAWRHRGIPTLEEYKAFIASPEATLKVHYTDGLVEEFHLEKLPHEPRSSYPQGHYRLEPFGIPVACVQRWEFPKQVATVRLLLDDGSERFVGKPVEWKHGCPFSDTSLRNFCVLEARHEGNCRFTSSEVRK